MTVGFDFYEGTDSFQGLNDLFASLRHAQSFEGAAVCIDFSVGGHDISHFQTVPFSDVIIVKIMSGRDLQGARSEFRVGMGIGNNRNGSIGKRKFRLLSDQVLIAGIGRGNGNGRISQNRFGSCRSNYDRFGPVENRIGNIP